MKEVKVDLEACNSHSLIDELEQKETILERKIEAVSGFVRIEFDDHNVYCDHNRDGLCLISHDEKCSAYKTILEKQKQDSSNEEVLSTYKTICEQLKQDESVIVVHIEL